jgi:hypothetical protein
MSVKIVELNSAEMRATLKAIFPSGRKVKVFAITR